MIDGLILGLKSFNLLATFAGGHTESSSPPPHPLVYEEGMKMMQGGGEVSVTCL